MQVIFAQKFGLVFSSTILRHEQSSAGVPRTWKVQVNVWTVNTMHQLIDYYNWGCDGVFTNYPDVCGAFVDTQKNS